ncbi:MAG: hypothetical protein JWL73_2101 [Actinomycetia bacterium]|nr:hypothetical protein [Actinomycetes bacterium]
MSPIAASDEGRHPSGPEALWGESWYFDFAASDGSYGGYVRLGLYPNRGVAWFWLALVHPDRPLVFIRDHAVPVPNGEALVLDGGAYRAEIRADQPLERWSVVVRGAARSRDDPAGAFHDAPTAWTDVDVRLEWVAAAPVFEYALTTRYEQTSHVTGSFTVDGRTTAVDAPGQRDHSWGVRDWWDNPWCWSAGTFADGRAFHLLNTVFPGGGSYTTGYTVAAVRGAEGWTEVTAGAVDAVLDPELLPTTVGLMVGDLAVTAAPIAHAPLLLVSDDGRESRFARTLMHYVDADGIEGTGWLESNWPPGTAPETAPTASPAET